MPRWAFIVCFLLVVSPASAGDGMAVITRAIENPALRGEAVFRWLGLPLYTARLYTPGGRALSWADPLALQLIYAREISRQSLVDATMTELERLEGVRADHTEIARKIAPCFRDVGDGDQFIATKQTSDELRLFFNGAQTCRLRHADISARFLNIWLSENSRSPDLSRQLRGG